jgi:dTMP kinase
MANKKGKIIVIEGTDGTGKTTQVALLLKRLKKEKINHTLIDYPRYGLPSAYFIEQYLNGKYGGPNDVPPEVASLFYALDRYEAKNSIKKHLDAGKIIIANRYTSSSMGHQGAKLNNPKERKHLFQWLVELEHGLLGIPKAHTTIILRVPAAMAQRLIDKKGRRAYISKKRDIHEADLHHLEAAEKTYLEMAKMFGHQVIECTEKGRLLTPVEIHEKIWQTVQKAVKL